MRTLQKLLCFSLVLCSISGWTQVCPEPVFPEEGERVPTDVTISWTEVIGVAAYLIRLGTTEGGSEITPLTSIGQATEFTPPRGLPENSTIYVDIFVFNTLDNSTTLCTRYSFETESFTAPPGCSQLLSPEDGATSVPIQSDILWAYAPTATSYRVILGLTPGGSELIDTVVDALSLRPSEFLPAGLPPETEIFVEIIPLNRLGSATGCEGFRFTTGPEATLPGCGGILYPADGEFNIPLSPVIRWAPVAGAEGYLVSIGTSPFDNNVLDNARFQRRDPETGEIVTETGVIDFEPNRQYFVTIRPFNSAGTALDCLTTSFFTLVGCGPYFDANGDLVDFSPEITFPESVGICSSGAIEPLIAEDTADGYRWYRIENENREVLLEQGPVFIPPGTGLYRLEIYDELEDPSGAEIECASSQVFTVTQSEPAIIEGTDVDLGAGVLSIEVIVSGIGDYEFALNDADGPYQESNRFVNLPLDNYRIFVRDRNGCGISEVLVEPDLTLEGFPKFFTPNGDGINDFWQFILPDSGTNPIRVIYIFDRYGNLLAQVDPQSTGWDGTFNGSPLPASDYWFRAVNNNNEEVRGHFSLKR